MVLEGPSFGDVFELNGEALVLGSDPFRADVVIRDIAVEPRHVKLYRKPDSGSFAIEDLDAESKIVVNGEAIEGGARLGCGDRIHVGDSILEFVARDPVRQRFHSEMQRLINEDYLTGLLAKNRFDDAFDHALEVAHERGLPLSVVMGDIDNLKRINDSHGHLLGEFTVGEIGRIIRESLTSGEQYATRFGGDEYQVLLVGVEKPEAITTAGEIRKHIEDYSFERDGLIADPTISFGVAAFPEDGTDRASLTQAADQALYRAKRAGGNTVSE